MVGVPGGPATFNGRGSMEMFELVIYSVVSASDCLMIMPLLIPWCINDPPASIAPELLLS